MNECVTNPSSTSALLNTASEKVTKEIPEVDSHHNKNIPSNSTENQKHQHTDYHMSGSNGKVPVEVEDYLDVKMEVDGVVVKTEGNEFIEVSQFIVGSKEFIQDEEHLRENVLEDMPELPRHLFSGTEESNDVDEENGIENDGSEAHDDSRAEPCAKSRGRLSTVYRCSFCKYKTIQKSHFQEHILIHSNTKLLKCPHCDYACNRRRILKSHLLVHAETRLFKCMKCDYECNYKSSLNTHVLSHSNIKLYKCSECEYGTNWKKDLTRHLTTHSKPKSRFIKCPKCDHVSSNKVNFQKHSLTHADKNAFKCSDCDFECEEESSLLAHSITHSKRNEQS